MDKEDGNELDKDLEYSEDDDDIDVINSIVKNQCDNISNNTRHLPSHDLYVLQLKNKGYKKGRMRLFLTISFSK